MCDCKHCVLYLAHLQYNSSSFNSECSVVTQFLIFTHYSRYVCDLFVDLFVTREEMYDKYCLLWSWVSMVLQQCPVSPLIVSRLSGSDQWCWGVPMVSIHSDHWSPAHLWVVCWGHLLSWDTLPAPPPPPHSSLVSLVELSEWCGQVSVLTTAPLLLQHW